MTPAQQMSESQLISAQSSAEQISTQKTAALPKHLVLLLFLFAASGCSALIYEVVWYQLLQLAIGSTSVSLGILLATFMGGLCIGSLWFPRIRTSQHPLRIYAALEAGTALLAILVQFGLPLLNRVYITGAEHGLPGMLLRGLLAAVCLLPPTILMGASLPAIVRTIGSTQTGVKWWGFLYGGNTAGAVFGCLFAGFYLLRIYNMPTTTFVAAAINVAVAILSYLLAGSVKLSDTAASSVAEPAAESSSYQMASKWPVYLTIALSGACALGAEVVWTRLLALLLLATVYVFSLILAVFLTGLAIGSAGGSWLIKRVNPRTALGWCQILLTLGFAWTAYSVIHLLPYIHDDVLSTTDAWRMYRLDLLRCVIAILPVTLFWGASFPLACAAVADPREDSGHTAGAVYAANTLGGIVGALLVSLIFIPSIGSQSTQRVLLLASAFSGLLVLWPLIRRSIGGAVAVIASLAFAGLLAWSIDPIPGDMIAYGRYMATNASQSEVLYTKEGRNSSVAITKWNNGAIYVNVNGHVEATTEIFDMKLQRMVGHLPALIHPHPKNILGIGFGAGVSAGTFTRYPEIEKITVCEIEPVIPPASTKYFGNEDYHVANNPKTHIVFDDARHYLMTTPGKFDIIASDPLDVFIKGTAALYSREYFEAVKQHLNPGGIFTLYVPLYETDETTIRSELATFFAAFPNGSVWINLRDGYGYDTVFMGQVEPLKINLDEVDKKFHRPNLAGVRESLADIGVYSIYDLFGSYTGSGYDLSAWTKGSPLNTDQDLKLSYLAGWGINSNLADYLYRQMLRYRQPPKSIFTGSPDAVNHVMGMIK